MNNIKLVMFDLEGVLIKHTTRQSAIIKESIEAQGVKVSISIEENYFLRSIPEFRPAIVFIKEILRRDGQELSEEQIEKAVKRYRELRQKPDYLADLQYLFDGSKELLEKLKEKGIICALISNSNPKQVHSLLKRFGIEKYFDLIVDDSSGLPDKPDPTRTKLVLEKFSILPKESILVEDAASNLATMKELGVKTCGVLTGNSTREMFEKENVEYILDSIKDLEQML